MHDPVIKERHMQAIQLRGKTKGASGLKRGPLSEEVKQKLREATD